MTYEPHKRLELMLRVATAEGDLEAIQNVLGALKKYDRETARDDRHEERKVA